MKTNDWLQRLPPVFSISDGIKSIQDRYDAPHKVFETMVRNHQLIRLKRGVYALNQNFDHFMAAQILHSPSYVSFETALSEYGLIPERVEQMLCVVDGRNRTYQTPKGEFVYHSQRRDLFALGMTLRLRERFAIHIATPEKALLDTLMRAKLQAHDSTPDQVWDYIISGLRMDEGRVTNLSLEHCQHMAPLYRSVAPQHFTTALAHHQNECPKRIKGTNHE